MTTIKAPVRRPRPGATQAPAKPAIAPKRAPAPTRPGYALPKGTKYPAKDAKPIDMTKIRVTPEWMSIHDLKPYAYNARDNAKAIDAVAKSIENFGFLVPCVVDDDGTLVAGHTRTEAAKKLGMGELLVIKASHLTEEQIDAFRLVDNKVSEIADWDTDLLGQELARLQDFGFDFTSYGWSQEEIDCLSSVVAADCLNTSTLVAAQVAGGEEGEEGGLSVRRGPQSTRLVLGELVVFVPSTAYRDWIDGIQRLHNFNKAEIEAEILNRLGFNL